MKTVQKQSCTLAVKNLYVYSIGPIKILLVRKLMKIEKKQC